jgi:hypothetical protein
MREASDERQDFVAIGRRATIEYIVHIARVRLWENMEASKELLHSLASVVLDVLE